MLTIVTNECNGLVCRWANVRTGSPQGTAAVRSHMGTESHRPHRHFNSFKTGPLDTEACQGTAWQLCEEPIHTMQVLLQPRRMDTLRRAPFSPAPTFSLLQRGTYPMIPPCPPPASWPRPGSTLLKPLFLFSLYTFWAILSSASVGCWLDWWSFSGGGGTQEGRTADWAELCLSLSRRREVSNRVWRPPIYQHG